MTAVEYIKNNCSLLEKNITATLHLFLEDCTIPFIARYRKDKTGNLNEVEIETIDKLYKQYQVICKRKETVLEAIKMQNKLSFELQQKITASFVMQEIEDLYLPYKKKRKTKADIARENGVEPLAKIIMAQNSSNLEATIQKYISEKVTTKELVLLGARNIIAEWISENIAVRNYLRYFFRKKSTITTKVVSSKKDDSLAQKYNHYFDWNEPLHKIPSHRLLAILRAEKEGYIKTTITVDTATILNAIEQKIIKNSAVTAQHIQLAIKDSYKRLLQPAISNEILQEYKQKADAKAIGIFSNNLRQLLLAPPLGEKRILAIDPGYKTGCKVVCLDEKGDLLNNETIYPHPPQKETTMAMKKIRSMVNAYGIEAISIGNGTASRETEFFIKKVKFDKPVVVFVVSEAGASVYSASKIAREEFPNYDVTVRGAVSIGRRLADPLAELVKIEPKSIGVGQYQHDVNQQKLKEELDATIIKCVNSVGININTASKFLLSYVSGIGEKLAENIVNYRSKNGSFTNRNQLKNVPRLGEKAFEQAAAFIRIKNGDNPLDNSAVHPESYKLVEKMANDVKLSVEELIGNKEKIKTIPVANYSSTNIGTLGLHDILKELEKPGLDPRKKTTVFEFDASIRTITDVKTGQILPGIVNNITAFGCFVDIGIKESGLIHISQLKKGFVSDVNEVVQLHQQLKVKVIDVDIEKKRIQLSLIF